MNATTATTRQLDAAQYAITASIKTCTEASATFAALEAAAKTATALKLWLARPAAADSDPNHEHTMHLMRMVAEATISAAAQAQATNKVAQQAFCDASESYEKLAGWRI
jgi:hypothetical protein